MPHALIDGLPNVSGISRICDEAHKASPSVMVIAILALVHCYKHHDMMIHGGISHNLVCHSWDMTVQPHERGFKATAKRVGDPCPTGSLILFRDVMASLGIHAASARDWDQVFQQGVQLLATCGLIYEVVTLFDAQFKHHLPIRINDYHAANQCSSEPSVNQSIPGASFYNSKTDMEIWLYSPTDLHSEDAMILGIYRMRFRGAESSTAIGLERNMASIIAHKKTLVEIDMIDDLVAI